MHPFHTLLTCLIILMLEGCLTTSEQASNWMSPIKGIQSIQPQGDNTFIINIPSGIGQIKFIAPSEQTIKLKLFYNNKPFEKIEGASCTQPNDLIIIKQQPNLIVIKSKTLAECQLQIVDFLDYKPN